MLLMARKMHLNVRGVYQGDNGEARHAGVFHWLFIGGFAGGSPAERTDENEAEITYRGSYSINRLRVIRKKAGMTLLPTALLD
jgi:hypothetical protein